MPENKRKRLLLVEDEAIIAMSTKSILEEYGYRVQVVLNGKAAVKAVAADPDIDLILMDINLGSGIDGTEAAALILKDYDLPVVFLSSHTEPDVVEKTEKITSYGYVVKDSGGTVIDASIKMAFKLFAAKIGEKEKERALRESEERYRAIFDNSLDAILLTTPDGRVLAVNAAAERLFGRPAEEIIRLGRNGILDAADPRLAAGLEERTRTGRFSGELTFLRKDGSKFPADMSTVVFRDREGNVRTSMIIHDITARRLAEQALRERNQYIESILNNMPIGFAAYTLGDGIVRYMNDRYAEIYGWPRNMISNVDCFFANVYPGPEGELVKAAALKDVETGDPRRMSWDDVPITTQTGERRYVSARNIPLLEQHLMVATVWDTTAIHGSLEALRDAEASYRLLFEQSPDGIVIIDEESMKIKEFNETAHRQLGYSREEFSGMSISDVEVMEKPEDTRRHIDQIMRDGQGQFLTKHRTRDGEIRDVLVRARYSILNGRPIYHCLWRDITGRKRREGD